MFHWSLSESGIPVSPNSWGNLISLNARSFFFRWIHDTGRRSRRRFYLSNWPESAADPNGWDWKERYKGGGPAVAAPPSKNQISIRAGGRPSFQFDGDIEGGSSDETKSGYRGRIQIGRTERNEDAGQQSFDLISAPKESWLSNLENWTVPPQKYTFKIGSTQ